MGFLKQKFRSIKKFPTWIYWIPSHLLWLVLRVFFRFRIEDPYGYIKDSRGAVVVTWHNRLLFFAAAFPKAARRRTVAVVSASRDGQYIADFIATLGLRSLRGSSSRGGVKAQLAAIHSIRDGYHVCFTPDGPRGPRYRMKNGPIQLASLTGGGVIPVSLNAGSCWSIRSWDGFQIPKPFTTMTLVLGEKVEVPPELKSEQLAEYRMKVEEALMAVTVDP